MIATDALPSALPANDPLDILVRQHIDMVYAAALRQLRDPHLAADVTQAVFIILQSKYPLRPGTVVAAWLLRTTRYVALAALQRQRRRDHHEQKAAAMRNLHQEPPPDHELTSFIDAALDKLGQSDRAAIILTYFEGLSHEQLADRLHISEQAAHKRVQRAIERLRTILTRKGAAIPAAGITATIATIARPAATPAAVMHATLASLSGKAPITIISLVKGALFMMKLLKVKTAGIVAALVTATSLTSAVLCQQAWAKALPPAPGMSVDAVAPQPPNTAVGQLNIAAAQTFLPEVSITLNHESTGRDFLLNLDRGQTLVPPVGPQNSFDVWNWISQAGVDLIYDQSRTDALMGMDLTAMAIPSEEFSAQGPDLARNYLNSMLMARPGTPSIIPIHSLPATYVFRTRAGGVGLLQITAIQENPKAAILHYKLMNPAARDAAALKLAADAVLPELRKQAQRLSAAASDDEIRSAGGAIVRTYGSLGELLKGSPAHRTSRLLESAVRIMSERLEDGEFDKAKDRAADILQTLDRTDESFPKTITANPPTPAQAILP